MSDDCKLVQGVTKRVLRQSMEGLLPEPVRSRTDKLGFVTPEEVWMRGETDLFRRKLRESVEMSNGVLTWQHCMSWTGWLTAGNRSVSSYGA